jgi:hypothetical protein
MQLLWQKITTFGVEIKVRTTMILKLKDYFCECNKIETKSMIKLNI